MRASDYPKWFIISFQIVCQIQRVREEVDLLCSATKKGGKVNDFSSNDWEEADGLGMAGWVHHWTIMGRESGTKGAWIWRELAWILLPCWTRTTFVRQIVFRSISFCSNFLPKYAVQYFSSYLESSLLKVHTQSSPLVNTNKKLRKFNSKILNKKLMLSQNYIICSYISLHHH